MRGGGAKNLMSWKGGVQNFLEYSPTVSLCSILLAIVDAQRWLYPVSGMGWYCLTQDQNQNFYFLTHTGS